MGGRRLTTFARTWTAWGVIAVCCGALTGCDRVLGPSPTPGQGEVGQCALQPNYLSQVRPLYRVGGFPLRVSIDRASFSLADGDPSVWEDGIREGARAWNDAMAGAIGQVEIDFDLPEAHVSVTLSESFGPEYDCYYLDCEGLFEPDFVELDRFIRGGRIWLFPEPLQRNLQRSHPTRLSELRAYVSNTMAHEMGHALGLMGHSQNSRDLMYHSGNFGSSSYPWVTERDRNTMAGNYCRP